MASNNGIFDSGKLIQHFLHYFGDEKSPYQVALIKRRTMKWPIEGPWLQGMNLCPEYFLKITQLILALTKNRQKMSSKVKIQPFGLKAIVLSILYLMVN